MQAKNKHTEAHESLGQSARKVNLAMASVVPTYTKLSSTESQHWFLYFDNGWHLAHESC